MNIYKVFVVLCCIDGQTEFDSVYGTEQAARAHCQRQNCKPSYYGRFTWHPTEVRDAACPECGGSGLSMQPGMPDGEPEGLPCKTCSTSIKETKP